MIRTHDLSVQYGERVLFENVSLKFTHGNCCGLIGPNGAGKSTLLKVLSGEIEPHSGSVTVPPGLRVAVLKQDHFAHNEFAALTTVLMGHERLYAIMQEKDALYAKPDFDDADGIRTAELESKFAALDGWEAEAQAGELLCGLGIPVQRHGVLVRDLDDGDKVRVLLAQAVFGDPDILLLDEPTNHLDVDSILWLEEFLLSFSNTFVVVSHDRHFLNKVTSTPRTLTTGRCSCTPETMISGARPARWRCGTGRRGKTRTMTAPGSSRSLSPASAPTRPSRSRPRRARRCSGSSTSRPLRPRPGRPRTSSLVPKRFMARKWSVLPISRSRWQGRACSKALTSLFPTVNALWWSRVTLWPRRRSLSVVAGAQEPDTGSVHWGASIRRSFLPKEYGHLFDAPFGIIDWLRQYSDEPDEGFIRQFLGRMLFTGEESKKSVSVLSGGERVRCMLARLMLEDAQCLILDGPTNHLDLESITALNTALGNRSGTLIFGSHDMELIESLSDRVIEITDDGVIDHQYGYAELLERRTQELPVAVGA